MAYTKVLPPAQVEVLQVARKIRDNATLRRAYLSHLMATPDIEAGGFILMKGDNFCFIPCLNDAPEHCRGGLFSPDDDSMVKVFHLVEDLGWQWVASVHSHPHFMPYPSRTDLTEIFVNHKVNIIHSFIAGTRFYDSRGVDLFPQPGQTVTPVLCA
jgi:proteasome lid subunit RPN8/RPN11